MKGNQKEQKQTNSQHESAVPLSSLKTALTHILLALFIFLLPTQLAKHFWPEFTIVNSIRIDYLAPKIYVTDILAWLLIILHIDKLIRFIVPFFLRDARHCVFTLLIILLLIVNIIFSASPIISLFKFVKIIELAGIGILIYHLFQSSNKQQRDILHTTVFGSFLFGAIFQLFLAILQLSLKESVDGIFYFFGERTLSLTGGNIATAAWNGVKFLRPYGTFSHPNSLGGFYLLVYALVLFDPFLKTKTYLRNTLLVVCSFLIIISFSKAAIGTYIILNIIGLILSMKKFTCPICILSKIFVFGTLGFIFMSTQGDPETIGKRIWLAQTGVQMMLDAPLVGTGLGVSLITQSAFPVPYPYHFLQPIHNIFLLALVEMGIPLFLFLCGGVYLFVKKYWHSHQLLACMFVIAVTGLVDHYWLTLQQNWLLIGVVVGYAIEFRSK